MSKPQYTKIHGLRVRELNSASDFEEWHAGIAAIAWTEKLNDLLFTDEVEILAKPAEEHESEYAAWLEQDKKIVKACGLLRKALSASAVVHFNRAFTSPRALYCAIEQRYTTQERGKDKEQTRASAATSERTHEVNDAGLSATTERIPPLKRLWEKRKAEMALAAENKRARDASLVAKLELEGDLPWHHHLKDVDAAIAEVTRDMEWRKANPDKKPINLSRLPGSHVFVEGFDYSSADDTEGDEDVGTDTDLADGEDDSNDA